MNAVRLLLVEDDATSAAFLSEALAALPAQVDVAGDIAAALELARDARHSLWLVDAHLPDGDGLDCLRALRTLQDTPALAITAGAPREELEGLCDGGFAQVLMKPVSVALLLGTVRRLLGLAVDDEAMQVVPDGALGGKLPVWEHERALAAIGGNPEALAKLRVLFLAELPEQRTALRAAASLGDANAVAAVLHRLRASCGFVGAARLARAVDALSAAPLDAARLRELGFAADDTLAAGAQR